MILEILISIIPGFLVVYSFYKKESALAKIILAILLDIIIFTFVSIFLGFNEFTYRLTGGLTKKNIFITYIVINIILLITYFLRKKQKTKEK